MKKFFLFLFLLAGPWVMAQKITLRGQLQDSSRAALPSATILLLSPKDSSLVNFGVTAPDGAFEIKNINRQDYIFKVSFVGYETLMRKVSAAPDQTVVDLGTLTMKPQTRQLDEVTIHGDKAPVVVKKDTIEFNATSFKVQQNAVVEDLLKRLPGVEVDNDGTIRAQGEQVQRVMVDGKNFFGSDPKLATRNLPADAIAKIQVFDKKSDQAVFSGVDDGQREKTINLELKEEKRNGAFGNLMAGVGTNDRYQAKASINRFRKGQQLSFLGMGNNVNEQGFGLDEYMNFTGGSQQMMGGRGGTATITVNGNNNQSSVPLNFGGRNSGIMKNYAGGLNFNQEFSKKTELNGSYFYNHLDHNVLQTTERTNFNPTGNLYYNATSNQANTNDNHRLNATLEHKLDSMNSLKWTNTVTYNETSTNEKSTSENLATDGSTLNQSVRNTLADGTSLNVSSNLLWRHRFARKGRTLSANGQVSRSESDRTGSLDANNNYYGETNESQNLLQTNTQNTLNTTYTASASYTEPLGGRKYLEANYNFRANLNDVDRRVYDVNSGEPVFNTSLSNQYTSNFQYHRAGLNFRLNRSAYNLTVGGSVQQTDLRGDLKLIDTKINKSYQNILPAAHFNYDFSSTKHLRFDYETSIQEPSIQQLQPVVDNSDPLNLSVGNPDLRPAYANNWRLNFNTFNPASFINVFSFVDATYTRNAIVTSQTFTDQQVRISRPVNVDHNLRLSANANVGFPIQKLGSRFSIGGSASRTTGTNVLNDVESNITQNTVGGRFRYDFRYKEAFDLSLSANISQSSTAYDYNPSANQRYFNNSYDAEANYNFLKYYKLSSSFDYLSYISKTTDFKQNIPLLNLSLSRYVLKGKAGEIKLAVNNVLDKSIGVSQTADVNYVQRQTTNNLGRYYMLSFTYALNRQLNPMGMGGPGPGRGGMMRIMRQ